MNEEIMTQLRSHREVMEAVERELTPRIAAFAGMLVAALKGGKKLLVMGNGGSAADAQHFAAEIVGRFKMERRGLPAVALTTDTSILTAIGNDYGFDAVFRRQVEALADEGDVVVGLSTSGSSRNVYDALALANDRGCITVGLLGRDGGTLKDIVDLDVTVPSGDTPRIQEGHITIIHIVCDLVEKGLFK
ncbi:phosphoheptose isomerase [Geobacter metallireducens RCH3]|uniref:Phosphoheptose isomerase n=1 Tax=Geobacter metallireducens (strain ATCC 53774 / DSM 7210 / GS-15) TaxID=269799 RepID=GMHA_GEOMG|nr:D-sedoheptulose 7-phosphate isomerase [Geobacter metallireducens]Q39X62.1 RecName: Full=Phosphoheptose isomerase; AltName: Full=Sedoheptulose 7-phosphate isomerase [Geobacter metallireducens GS-15]ABB31162.1 D-sedoheptulose-7-phosphate isomerase [Geobacter metallireducens GS-15]EHP85340.1 phosphoheptose isomerase [Geobacter metallireducens RCH3]